jgi:Uma2 family endonuclease
LTLPAAGPERPRVRFTVGQLLSMQQAGLLYGPYGERHVELIGGELIEMPAPGPIHDTVSQRLQDLLAPLGNGRLRVEKGLSIPEYDMPIPDLVVLRAAVEWRMVEPADCLCVIEVCDSTYEADRRDKLPRYLAAGIPLIWLVNCRARQIEAYDQQDWTTEAPHKLRAGSTAQVAGISVPVGPLFAGMPHA